ncbi:PDZ and LIM domain protein Zasp-like [Octopus sinensis]|uniref:PDZ and LIM domain protein Zasp-like n=1 Tax=Octopus sinensis TaxID=2607531 RepID=A0A6P7TZB1_9MOLL|nr:PDZ and LIM domain protein Zasp-like [Octopus sinensis]
MKTILLPNPSCGDKEISFVDHHTDMFRYSGLIVKEYAYCADNRIDFDGLIRDLQSPKTLSGSPKTSSGPSNTPYVSPKLSSGPSNAPYVSPKTSSGPSNAPYVSPKTSSGPSNAPYVSPKTSYVPYVSPKDSSEHSNVPYVSPKPSSGSSKPSFGSSNPAFGSANLCSGSAKSSSGDSKWLTVRGPYVTALEKTYCRDHFTCAVSNCGVSLVDTAFSVHQDKLYCREHYAQYYAPRCEQCGEGIVEVVWGFMPGVYSCPGVLFLETRADWEYIYAKSCADCRLRIDPGDRYIQVEALGGQTWHTECFRCSVCRMNLAGVAFVSRNSLPQCSNH